MGQAAQSRSIRGPEPAAALSGSCKRLIEMTTCILLAAARGLLAPHLSSVALVAIDGTL
jgi:hypothetical protein